MIRNTVVCGDSLSVLRLMPTESVHCCVTSPPYWGLRDYGCAGQLGLESTPAEYLAKMVTVFEEVRRLLRKDGTLWVNMGDCYSDSQKGWTLKTDAIQNTHRNSKRITKTRLEGHSGTQDRALRADEAGRITPGLKSKDLIGMPWRLAFALQAAGWYLRSDIIWHKPNPMPESVTDRPTKAHEYLFLLSKSARYFYDAEAIKEEFSPNTKQASFDTMDFARRVKYAGALEKPRRSIKVPAGWDTSNGAHGKIHKNGRAEKQRGHSRRHAGFNERWDGMSHTEQRALGANKRTVWTVPTQGFSGAHFATFPEKLIEPCIRAGCPVGGVVLDPFMGAFTTALVALKLGRDYYGAELNPTYIALGEKRLAEQVPVLMAANGKG